MTISPACKAKDPNTCRFHGKFNKQYDAWKAAQNGIEPVVVFQRYTVKPIPVSSEVLGFEQEKDQMIFFFAGEYDKEKYGSDDVSVTIPGKSVDEVIQGVRSRRNHPTSTSGSADADRLESIGKVLGDGSLEEVKRRTRALQAGWNAPFLDEWDVDASTVAKVYAYGEIVDKLNLQKEEEKAIMLTQTMMKNENFSSYDYKDEEFDDTVKGVWSIYKTYKRAIERK